MPNLQNILVHFLPELILAVGAIVVLLYDVIVRGRDRAQGYLAIATVLLAIGATLWLYTVPPAEAEPVTITHSSGQVIAQCGQQSIYEVRDEATGSQAFGVEDTRTFARCGTFVADGFTQFFRLLGGLATLLVILAGFAFMRGRTPFKGEFYAILLLATLAMNLMAGANDLIMIAIAIEFLSVSSYILTGFLRGNKLSIEGGLKYFLYGSITSAAMLYGFSLLYGATSTTSLPAIGALLGDPESLLVSQVWVIVVPALIFILVGVAFKIALVPFHQWSPDAYHGAPTPVTSFLSVGPKLAGFAVLLRLLMTAFSVEAYSSQWAATAAGIAVITMVFGNIAALRQKNVKRMMAYSSIAQAGFILVAVAALGSGTVTSGQAIAAVLVFLLAYLFTNLGAFAVIIGFEDATGSSEIDDYAGLMKRSPLLAVSLAVFFLSLVGIPPLAGFIGKFSVFSAAIAGGQIFVAVVGVLAGVVSVGYYFRVVRQMFFVSGQDDEETTALRVAPLLKLVVVVSLVMVFLIGLYADPFLTFTRQAAETLVPFTATVVASLTGPT
jgi:proton-translocating NADH-quinone oxidoreductase chain N